MGPIAIRYPRGAGVLDQWEKPFEAMPFGKGLRHKKGTKIAVVCLGPLKHAAMTAITALEKHAETAQQTQGAFGIYGNNLI